MKVKTIEKLISKKFNEFLESIKDKKVKLLVKENSIITGGSIASMFLNEKVNDYDIYFTNEYTVLSVAKYYLDIFNKKNDTDGRIDKSYDAYEEKNRIKISFSNITSCKEKGMDEQDFHELGDTIEIKNDEGELYRPIFLSSNAITLSGQIQIIIRFYGKANQIHDNYDFQHCVNYWSSNDEKVFVNQKSLECLLTKELYYVGSKYPLASIIRIRKFIMRGWQINAGQILKICYQISKLDLNDVEVLQEQLTGVDLAYFSELLEAIRAIPEGTNLNYNYLVSIIDKIF